MGDLTMLLSYHKEIQNNEGDGADENIAKKSFLEFLYEDSELLVQNKKKIRRSTNYQLLRHQKVVLWPICVQIKIC